MATLKLRNNEGIKIDAALKSEFPAIFNKRRSTNVSEDYQMYNSAEVIDLMLKAGLRLVEVGQEKLGWSQKRQPHTQVHTMRFTSPEFARGDFGVGDSFPEIVIMNSHDGRCVFRAMAGVFRLVCSNGMVVADQNFGIVRRRHFGEANAFAKVREIIADMPKVITEVSGRIEDWSRVRLSTSEQIALARASMDQKVPTGSVRAPAWLLPEQVLEARRDGERVDSNGTRDLWTTFNVIQESLTNARIPRLAGEGRARSIQPVTDVVGNTGFNQRLWATAEAYFNEHLETLAEEERAEFDARRAARLPAPALIEA